MSLKEARGTFDTELYSNTSWLRVCRYVEPDVGSVRASVGRLPTSHPEVGVGVGVGEVVGVGEPRATRLNQDAAAALPQVCSERFGAVGRSRTIHRLFQRSPR